MRQPDMLLIDRFEATARERPDHLFLRYVAEDPADDVLVTYGEADRAASRFAAALRARGVVRGDTVAILLPNMPNWLLWHFANQKIGATTCTLNPDLLPGDLAGLIGIAGASVVVTGAALASLAGAIRAAGAQVLFLDQDTGAELGEAGRAPDVGHVARDPAIAADANLSVVFTSGTTGARSKAVLMPVGNVVRFAGAYKDMLGLDGGDRLMMVTPLYHAAALHWTTGMAVLCGGSLVLADRFRKSQFWHQADRAGATVIWTMAAVLFILLTEPAGAAERSAMSRMKVVFGNGAAGRAREIIARWGPVFRDGFGMSEAFGTLTDADSFDTGEPYPCAGRAVPGIEMRLRDPQTGAFVGPREQGEIVMRYGQGFGGYLGDPEATAQVVRDGWFHTGDIGYVDETGRLFFVDRLKEIIRRGGKNISAKEIENVLLTHPAVAEAAAIGKPDDILGETVMVLLVAKDPGYSFTLDEIRAFCKDRLAAYKWPAGIVTLKAEALPRTPTGKIKKLSLKQQLREGTGAFAS